jgi:hypothetical protein
LAKVAPAPAAVAITPGTALITHEAATQLDAEWNDHGESVGARGSARGSARGVRSADDDALITTLREQLSRVRRRCEALEQRLDGEGAVLLATHKRQQQQIVVVTQAHEHMAFHAAQVRAILAAKLASNGRHAHMRLVLHGWRLEACNAIATRAAVAEERARSEAEAARAAAERGYGASSAQMPTLPELPPLDDRKQLYRSSYEALIDRVLELQETLHAYADALGRTSAKAAPASK